MRWVAGVMAVALFAGAARADWVKADLFYGDFQSTPITSIATPGPSDVWALSPYGFYTDSTKTHARYDTSLYHSINDGLLWDLAYDGGFGDDNANSTNPQNAFHDAEVFSIAFADLNNGWAFGVQRPAPYNLTDPPGPYVFLHTTDRGHTWSTFTLPDTEPEVADLPDFSIDAIDATHAIAVQGRHVFETPDGVTWRERPGAFPDLFSVQALGLATPHAAGTDGDIGVAGPLTANGFTPSLSAPGAFYATRFSDDSHGWTAGAKGSDGFIFGTADGVNWNNQLVTPNVNLRALAAPDNADAWAVGGGPADDDPGSIYHTADGGASWSLDETMPDQLFSVSFRDRNHGFAGGVTGLYRYVPPTPVLDAPSILLRASGLVPATAAEVAQNDTNGDGVLTIADAVSQLRSGGAAAAYGSITDPSRVVVVYNTATPDTDGDGMGDSLEVANYYMAKRGIPAGNLVAVTCPDNMGFTNHRFSDGYGRANWGDVYSAVVQPLERKIDQLGRTNVNAVVFTLGVPYQFTAEMPAGTAVTEPVDTCIEDIWRTDAQNWTSWQPYGAPRGDVATRYGMPRFQGAGRPPGQPAVALSGAVLQDPVYLVGRIDGPSLDACFAMVDNAIFAEKYHGPGGYTGNAYVDVRPTHWGIAPYTLDELQQFVPAYDTYTDTDESIDRTVLSFDSRGYPWKDELTDFQIGQPGAQPVWRDGTPATAAPRAMFYGGWYNYGVYNDAFDWLPGSVGLDLDSASAADPRHVNSIQYWGSAAIAHGLTAIAGSIAEPTTDYHPKPDVLMEYLLQGFTYGEAASLATEEPRTAEALILGDPLYQPFGHAVAPVPVPTFNVASSRSGGATVLKADSSIPVRAVALYTVDGSTPTADSPAAAGVPAIYGLHHTFTIPASANARYVIQATDATGRVTTTSPVLLP